MAAGKTIVSVSGHPIWASRSERWKECCSRPMTNGSQSRYTWRHSIAQLPNGICRRWIDSHWELRFHSGPKVGPSFQGIRQPKFHISKEDCMQAKGRDLLFSLQLTDFLIPTEKPCLSNFSQSRNKYYSIPQFDLRWWC
jgi:hypothetical protein